MSQELLERIAVALEKIAEKLQLPPAETQLAGQKKGGKKRASVAKRDKKGHFLPSKPQLDQQQLEPCNSVVALGEKNPNATLAIPGMAVSRSQVKRHAAQGNLGHQVFILIGVYVKAWQARYQTKARPSIGGKEQGILKRLLGQRSTKELAELLQVYCQMKNEWFKTKKHDLGTFEQNLNEVVLALSGGKEHNGIDYNYVFSSVLKDEKNMGGGNENRDVSQPDRQAGDEVWPEALLPGDSETSF